MRCNALSSRTLVMAAFALALSACNGNSGLTAGAAACRLSRLRERKRRRRSSEASPRLERQNQARRHHRSREPLLQQPVLRLSRGDDGEVRLRLPPARRSRSSRSGWQTTWDIDHSSYAFFAVVQRHGQHSRHELPDERLR